MGLNLEASRWSACLGPDPQDVLSASAPFRTIRREQFGHVALERLDRLTANQQVRDDQMGNARLVFKSRPQGGDIAVREVALQQSCGNGEWKPSHQPSDVESDHSPHGSTNPAKPMVTGENADRDPEERPHPLEQMKDGYHCDAACD